MSKNIAKRENRDKYRVEKIYYVGRYSLTQSHITNTIFTRNHPQSFIFSILHFYCY